MQEDSSVSTQTVNTNGDSANANLYGEHVIAVASAKSNVTVATLADRARKPP